VLKTDFSAFCDFSGISGISPLTAVFSQLQTQAAFFGRRKLRPRKQCVGLAHQPVGNEADPLLRGHIEMAQGFGARSES
jgi:hypothetical protein